MSQFEELKEKVYQANMSLFHNKLTTHTFGNASEINRDKGVIGIKPSGVCYEQLKVEDIVICDLNNKVVEGKLRPSSDTKTHTHLYRSFPNIGGVVHTHSSFATAWAQTAKPIPCLGTTHADYTNQDIPCTKFITREQIQRDYEEETGVQIVDAFQDLDPNKTKMVLVAGHGPFTWGHHSSDAVYHSIILEELARISYYTLTLNPNTPRLEQSIIDKHFQRRQGKNAYYGQSS